MRIRNLYIVLVLIFSFLLPISIVNAQTIEQRIEKLEKQVHNQGQLIEWYQSLPEKIEKFQAKINKQVEEFQSLIQTQLSVVIILLLLFGAVLIAYKHNSLRKSKNQLAITIQETKEEINQALEDMREKTEKFLQEQQQKLEEEVEKRYREQLLKLLEEDKNVEAIKRIVHNKLSYTSSRIGIVSRSKQGIEKLQEKEIPLIEQSGMKKKISLLTFEHDKKQIEEKIKKGEIDVLIYYCEKLPDGEKFDQFLFDLVDLVVESKQKISLITYTYQGRWLKEEENAKANELIHTSANFPVTLLTHLLSLAYVFNRSASQSGKSVEE